MKDSITLIIAEDHKLFRKLLSESLVKYNIKTIADVANGLELIKKLENQRPDVVLLDIEMPELNGCDALDRIRKYYPEQKIIILTQHENKILKEYLMERGADDFLTKNTDIEEIANVIREVNAKKVCTPMTKKRNIKCGQIKFSEREHEIIPLLCEGRSNKEIADKLNIGSKTVEAHKKSLFKKTKTLSAVQCVGFLIKQGLNNIKRA